MRGDVRARALRAGVVLAAVVLGTGACTPLDDVMVAIFGRSMRDQPSFDPYENPRLPAENAVPFASGNYPAQIMDVGLGQAEGLEADVPPMTQRDVVPPGSPAVLALENPVPATPESLARGQLMYERFCLVCHGATGMSVDAPIREKLPVVAAYPPAGPNAAGYGDGYIYSIIRVGRGLMPAYGHQIPHYDRWHIVNYVRQLQQQAAAPAGAAPDGGAPAAGDTAAAGQGGN